MRRIIENKVYDTATATAVANYSNSYGTSDFKFIRETLFMTKKKNFFIHGRGGAMTRYADRVANMSCYGEAIRPLDEQQLLEWCFETENDFVIEEHMNHLIDEA